MPWRVARVLPETAFLSLNASPELILAGSELSDMTARWEGPIVLEITEHRPIADYDQLHTALHALGRPSGSRSMTPVPGSRTSTT